VAVEFAIELPKGRCHAELAKHLAWSGSEEGWRPSSCTQDPSGLESLRMTPLNVESPKLTHYRLPQEVAKANIIN
jgi:hypothetical protein